MTVAVTGWAAVSGVGGDAGALADAMRRPPPPPALDRLDGQPVPGGHARALVELDTRAALGRKGTGFFDRWTGLAVLTSGQALADSGLKVDDAHRDRIGLVVGTTAGSLKSVFDYTIETLVQERPYRVNPGLFPNTVMNSAAGQSAIWHGTRGVNATVAGGCLAFLNALRYTDNALGRYADAIVTGAVEELTPHTAWITHLGGTSPVPPGEGAAFFVAERPEVAAARGAAVVAEVLAHAFRFSPAGDGATTGEGASAGASDAASDALARAVRTVLDAAGARPADVGLVAVLGEDPVEERAVRAALDPPRPPMVEVRAVFGECQAALGALQLAGLLARATADPALDGRLALMTGHAPEGAVGAALVRLSHHGHARRR